MKRYRLYNGVMVPSLAFGTWQLEPETAYEATLCALKCGYRHIDTAYAYQNEKAIGDAIRDSGVQREDIFLTSKLPSDIKSYEGAWSYFKASRDALGVSYLDLYLIHAPWPWSDVGKDCMDGNVKAFEAFIDLYRNQEIISIGVSNFNRQELLQLEERTSFRPMVDQIRFFVGNIQKETYEYCQKNSILVEAYSPLATGKLLLDERIGKMAEKYQTEPSKILLQYCLEKKTLPIVKSSHRERIEKNLDLPFYLMDEDVKYLDSLVNVELRKPYRY